MSKLDDLNDPELQALRNLVAGTLAQDALTVPGWKVVEIDGQSALRHQDGYTVDELAAALLVLDQELRDRGNRIVN